MELVNVDTGGRVVERCWLADDEYQRTPDDSFGDLYVEWNRDVPIERIWSPAVGSLTMPTDHWRMGDHVREGLLRVVLQIGIDREPDRRAVVRGVFDDLGAPGGAAKMGQIDKDHSVISVLPPQA